MLPPKRLFRGTWLYTRVVRARAQALRLRGDGLLTATSSITTGSASVTAAAATARLVVTAGEVIATGGLVITAGGASIASGGLSVAHSAGTVLSVYGASATYANTVASFDSGTPTGVGFSMMDIMTQGTSMASIRGDGRLFVKHGGAEVQAGGLMVRAGGGVVTDGGVTAHTLLSSSSALRVSASSSAFTGTVWNVVSGRGVSPAFLLTQLSSSTAPILTVQGDGYTTLPQGGLQVVSGGATVHTGQLVIDSGVTISSGGLRVAAGGATISVMGLTIDNDGSQVCG